MGDTSDDDHPTPPWLARAGCDARPALQAAIDAAPGREVLIPNGEYLLTQEPGTYRCLRIPPGTTLRGESRDGVVLRMAPGAGPSVQLIDVTDAPDVTIRDLTLDGNKAVQSVDPHRGGVFARQSPRLSLRGVTARNFTGDGCELVDRSDDVTVFDVLCTGNDRNGLTLGGGTTGGTFASSQFVANRAQQFDSEGAPVNDVTITRCLFDARGASNDYVLTMTGMGAGELLSRGWSVTDCEINGPAGMVWIEDVVFARNRGVNPTTKPSLHIYRTTDRILVHDCMLTATGRNGYDAGAVIYVVGTGLGQAPGRVAIFRNLLTTLQPAYGITAVCARDVEIVDNAITGAGIARLDEAGIFVRATRTDVPVERLSIMRNTVRNFGAYGVLLGGNGAARILETSIVGNAFSDTSLVPTMLQALRLGDDTDTARLVTQYDNTIAGGVARLIARSPGGGAVPWGSGTRWTMP